MNQKPLVTIGLPTIGRTRFWPQLRESLEAQTMKDFEIVVADNACPAEAREMLAAWAAEEPRMRILRVDARVPMFPNFNRSLNAARGEYYVNINDDDVYEPRFLEVLVSMMQANSRVGFAGSNMMFVDQVDTLLETRSFIRATEVIPGRQYIHLLMSRGSNPIGMPGILLRRSAIDERGFDEKLPPYYGDFVFLMRIAETHDVGFVAEPLIRIRRHETQASVLFDHAEGNKLRASLMRAYCTEFRHRWPNDEAFARCLERACERANRRGSVWAWMTARDRLAADACLDALGTSQVDRILGRTLRKIDGLGIDADVRRKVVPLVRRVGHALRV